MVRYSESTGTKFHTQLSTRYARVDFTKGEALLRNLGKAANEEMRALMEQVAYTGAERMKERILDSGTAFSARALKEGINKKRGRYRTGAMYNDVTWRAEIGPKRFYAVFGWIKRMQDYYQYQETGFRNHFFWASPLKANEPVWRNGGAYKITQGMFALWDARQEARNLQEKLVKGMAARVLAKAKKGGK